ncbi:hypothetical protein PIB30_082020 [Stylosanthes scabra]|uniref:Retrotransposon gag domain-containing protein n=1 Tax=Stylosanthes scabra TaxID=79078 RepID=A0ABU6XSV6_9FABA|nr:hypothetical protein [Stylosanthes scabra]
MPSRKRGNRRVTLASPTSNGGQPDLVNAYADIAVAIREPAAAIRESNAARDRERQRNGNGDRNGDGSTTSNYLTTLTDFMRLVSSQFSGTTDPSKADDWFAEHWWKGIQRLLGRVSNVITWDEFRKKFYKKYFAQSARSSKDLGFPQFEQGRLSLAKYIHTIKDLCRLSQLS